MDLDLLTCTGEIPKLQWMKTWQPLRLHVSGSISVETEQTTSANEDHVIWLKASKLTMRWDYYYLFIFFNEYLRSRMNFYGYISRYLSHVICKTSIYVWLLHVALLVSFLVNIIQTMNFMSAWQQNSKGISTCLMLGIDGGHG